MLASEPFIGKQQILQRPADQGLAKILGVGTATHEHSYSQLDVLSAFNIDDRRIRLMFQNSAIGHRHLILPPKSGEGTRVVETQGELLQKHAIFAVEIGSKAVLACLERAGARLEDISYLCCVTTTGLLTPGLSALLCQRLKLRRDCSRIDIVGMGCNAGLNGLTAVDAWARANPGKLAVMLCAEICSAAYIFDNTMKTAVVNSLFGDGASAVALKALLPTMFDQDTELKDDAWCDEHEVDLSITRPTVIGFASCVVSEAVDAMKFVWDENHGKFSFVLAQDVPYVVGANVEQVVDQLLAKAKLRRSEISHWIVHSGGKKVIDSVKINLGLTSHDLRHTSSVLHDYGNMSSGSFLFSYERLVEEGAPRRGDYGVMMTMGPGTTIETALIRW